MLKPVTALLLLGSLLAAFPASASIRTEAAACSPKRSILKSPRVGSKEVQAKALNDRGDVVGFADSRDGTTHAILWKGGKVARAVDLGVVPGYVSSEAYGVNNDRVVFGLLYDTRQWWRTPTSPPQLLDRASPDDTNAELVDVNDRGQAAGMSGTFTENGFPVAEPAIWRTGWAGLRTLRVPAVSRAHRVVVTQLNDINARGAIVGNVYGLTGKAFNKLRRIYPVLWTCPFGR